VWVAIFTILADIYGLRYRRLGAIGLVLESIYLVHIAWRDCMSFASICLHKMRRDEYEDRINEENLHLLSAPFVLNV
jgi:hypothetical protein